MLNYRVLTGKDGAGIPVAFYNAMRYSVSVIKTFADKETARLYLTGKSRKFPEAALRIGIRKLDYLNAAAALKDLKIPPGNRLEQLKGRYEGKYSIRINDQYRIVFRFVDRDAYEVEITDYH